MKTNAITYWNAAIYQTISFKTLCMYGKLQTVIYLLKVEESNHVDLTIYKSVPFHQKLSN